MRILLVEDDAHVADAVWSALTLHGAMLTWLSDGERAVDLAIFADLVLLNPDLPDVDGLHLCRRIRARTEAGVIIMSARGEIRDRIRGLDSGADDYLPKPFDVGELAARVQAVLRRRGSGQGPTRICASDIEIDIPRHEVFVAGEPVHLTRKEFQLIALLAAADGEVCRRERLIAEVWGEPTYGANRSLDVHIGTLRRKLGHPEVVVTIRGVGYRLAAP